MATGFIKKNWQKDATNVLVEAAIRAGGGVATAFVTNKFFVPQKTEDGGVSKTLHNIGGPLMLAAGVLGDMMLADNKFKAFFQGMSTYAALHSIAVISPDGIAPRIGIEGLAGPDDAQLFNGIGATATNELSTTTTPPELAEFAAGQQQIADTDGKTYNNDWAYLAENINNADQITRSVNGAESEAAALMGVTSDEEASKLMSMF